MTLAISIIFLTALSLLIHELGHLVAALRFRVTATELALGLGPRLCGVRLGGVEFTLRALPLGSFVRLDGKELLEKSVHQQLLIHLGGVIANLLFCVAFYGTMFGWLNLLLAVGNLLPIYQQDGWKCGRLLMRYMIGRASRPVEWTYTFSGVLVSLMLLQQALMRLGG